MMARKARTPHTTPTVTGVDDFPRLELEEFDVDAMVEGELVEDGADEELELEVEFESAR